MTFQSSHKESELYATHADEIFCAGLQDKRPLIIKQKT